MQKFQKTPYSNEVKLIKKPDLVKDVLPAI